MLKLPALLGLVAVLLGHSAPVWIQRSNYVMGTELTFAVGAADRGTGLLATEAGLQVVHRLERVLSDWDPESELSRLNQSDPKAGSVMSGELTSLLGLVLEWTRKTRGAFDPGLGSLEDAWDVRGSGRVPSRGNLDSALAISGLLRFEIDTIARRFTRPDTGSWIDAGGFGKGAALNEAVRALQANGAEAGILNFGGQIAVFGDTTVVVDVARPDARLSSALSVHIHNLSVSTSSQSERFIEVDGVRYGHILDPRTGSPVLPWGSVTVVHPDPTIADILSTALFVMGPADGMEWLQGQGIAALFQVRSGDHFQNIYTREFSHLLDHPPIISGE